MFSYDTFGFLPPEEGGFFQAMSEVISVGPLIIRTEMLLYVLSGIGGFLFMRYRLRKMEQRDTQTYREKVEDILTGAVVAYLLAWKLSVLLFYPGSVLAEPLALLYMPGGGKGVMLGVIVALAYMGVRVYRQTVPFYAVAAGFVFSFVMAGTVYYFLRTALMVSMVILNGGAGWDVIQPQPGDWPVILHTLLFLLLALWLILRRNEPLPFFLRYFLIWFGLGELLISLFTGQQQVFVLGLSKSQWVYLGLALAGIFWPEGWAGRKKIR